MCWAAGRTGGEISNLSRDEGSAFGMVVARSNPQRYIISMYQYTRNQEMRYHARMIELEVKHLSLHVPTCLKLQAHFDVSRLLIHYQQMSDTIGRPEIAVGAFQ
jgi:hypothetical protein